MNKEEIYIQLVSQIDSLVAGENYETGVLANITAAIHDALGYFWVGFYMVDDGELRLGPFQGSLACFRIKRGKGVCGTAWDKGETLVVPDVEQFQGHIACSSLSRSEIVVPVFDGNGNVKCVLDIDSTELNTFDDVDKKYLEKIADIIRNSLYT